MTKREFVEILEQSLQGQLPPQAVADRVQYYRDYIAGETAKGRSEERVLEELGDPRLIARSILSAAGAAGSREASRSGDNRSGSRGGFGKSWKWVLILLAVLVLALLLVTRVIFVILRLMLTPAFWVFLALAFGAGYFFRRR